MLKSISPVAVSSKNLVSFEVGDVLYAVDIYRVKEIIRPLPTLALPHAEASVVGVADHRGHIVPVIDLRARFGLPPADNRHDARWVIITRGNRLVGLAVDRVCEVFEATAAQGRDVPEMGLGSEVRGIQAAYSYRGGLVFVLDADRLASIAPEVDGLPLPPGSGGA